MAAYPISNFFEGIRTLLGDDGDPVEGYDYRDAQLAGAIRTVVRMGMVPCLELAAGDNPPDLTGPPPNPDTWGYVVAQAARSLIGAVPVESVRTRAMSIAVDAASRRDAVTFLDTLISDLDARGNLCGSATDTGHKGLFGTEGDVMTYIGFRGPCGAPPIPPWPLV